MIKFEKEKYYGNIEYKLKLIDLTKLRIEKYISQMRFRLIEGDGIAVYIIGVTDNGYIVGIHNLKKTFKNFKLIIKKNNAKIMTKKMFLYKNKLFLIFKIKSKLFKKKFFL